MEITKENLGAIIGQYPAEGRYALAVMQDIQRHCQYIPREGMEQLSSYIGTPLVKLYAMATFYKALNLKARGRHIIKVCDGTACHIKGSTFALDCIRRQLGIGPGETTTDGMFSVETVNCLGACAIAPVLVVDGEYYPKMTDEKIAALLADFAKGGEDSE